MVGVGIIAPILPLYADSLGATGFWIGFIYAGFAISRTIFMPIIGRLSDQRGRKLFITLGLLLYSFISLGYVYSRNVYELAGVRLISGFGSAMVTPIAFAYAAEVAPMDGEGRVFGEMGMALAVGIGIGVLIGGLLSDHFGMAVPFYTLGVLSTFTLILVLWRLPNQRSEIQSGVSRGGNLRKILRYDLVKGVCVFRFVSAFSIGAIMSFIPIYAAGLEITPAGIGILLSVNIVLAGLFQPFFGSFADRRNRVQLVFWGNIIFSVALLLVPYAGSFRSLLILNFIMGTGGAIALPASLTMLTDIGREEGMGSILGVYNSAMSLGMATGPIVAGVVMDMIGVSQIFTLSAVISIIGSLYFLGRATCAK